MLTDTLNLVGWTLCSLMIVVIFVRGSVESLADPAAAPWPVVVERFCSVVVCVAFDEVPFWSDLERTSDFPLESDLLVGALDLSLSLVSDFGDCPVVSRVFPAGLLSGVAWPVVCGVLWSPAFNEGATFSAGAFCCAAGARSGGSLLMPCAEATPPPSSNAIATVVSSFVFLTGLLLWMPPKFPMKPGPGAKTFAGPGGSEA